MTAPAERAALSLAQIRKSYPGTTALRDVSLDVGYGQVHALVGNNGSGKSTLVKVLVGVHHGDRGGSIAVGADRIAADRTSAGWARRVGLRFVHQDPAVFPDLSVAENLALTTTYPTRRGGAIDWDALRHRADALLRRFAIDATPDTPVRLLQPAAVVLLAIARALEDARESRVLVLDEPTALLPVDRSRNVWEGVRHAVALRHAVLFVSHRLDEVVAEAGAATVLRDGHVVARLTRTELTESRLAGAMAGRVQHGADAKSRHRTITPSDHSAPALAVEGLHGSHVRDVTFAVHRGEVLGITGPIGAGQSELLEMLFGARPIRRGAVRLHGKAVRFDDIADAMRAGIAYVPPDRAEAAFPELSLFENITAASVVSFRDAVRVRRDRELASARSWMDALSIRAFSPRQSMGTISGGNQQKALLARWLLRRPSLLLLSEPTQGVDFEARADIHELIRNEAEAGRAVVVASSDFRELASLCDRVIVMTDGEVMAELHGDDVNAARLAELALATPAR